jgi:3-methyladenine DNA glycosylase Tag
VDLSKPLPTSYPHLQRLPLPSTGRNASPDGRAQSDQEYFGLLARAVFSAGLGPKVVESRWGDIAQAFHSFDPTKVKEMDQSDVDRLLQDKAVIRNRRKIEAVISNAATFIERAGAFPSFHAYLAARGADEDLDAAAEELTTTFTHLGRTSALFFLFSAGWRPREAAA